MFITTTDDGKAFITHIPSTPTILSEAISRAGVESVERVALMLPGAAKSLAEGLEKHCGLKPVWVFTKRFPDGESYIRIPLELVKGKEVVVVQSMYPNQNDRLVELMLTLEALSGYGIDVSSVLVPYVAYARQDRRFLEGEPVSIKAVLEALKALGMRRLVTVDIHKEEPLRELGIEFVNVLPFNHLAKTIREAAGEGEYFVLAPDRGALHRAQQLASELGSAYDHLDKYRDRVTGEIRVSEKELDVKGKIVVVVDDIVSTGGTLAKAIELVRKLGAAKVYAAISHTLLVNNAEAKLENAGIDLLITTNSVEVKCEKPWIRVVDVSPILCEHLCKA